MAGYEFGTIEISIEDPKSIEVAVLKILQLKRGLTKALSELDKFMLDEGVTIARREIVRLCDANTMSGDLWLSVKSSSELSFDEETGRWHGYISAGEGLKTGKDGMSYAVYVEFGTGIYAGGNAKQPTTSWGSTLKLPGKKTEAENPKKNAKPMHFQGSDGKWYTSYGQPPKHFMANTMYELWSRAQKKWTELLNQYVPHEMG